MNSLVFVYGTLRRGECRNSALARDTRISEEAYLEHFRMLDLGSFPGLVAGEGRIRGEVYEVSPETLRNLDRMEGYNPRAPQNGLYDRQSVEVRTATGELLKDVLVYVFNGMPARPQFIESGDWFAHRDLYEQD